MREMQNLPAIRPAFILKAQATCPINAGDVGEWLDSNDGLKKTRNADGTDTIGGQASVKTLAVKAATTAALAGSPVYANGTLGVGATLTKGTNGALPTQDGVTLSVGDLLLVWQEATPANNGIYQVTTLGSGSVKWVLTRVAQFAESAQMIDGTMVAVQQGTKYADNTFKFTTTSAPTVGTTALAFALLPVTQIQPASERLFTIFTGHNNVGACTLTGAKVGDKVAGIVNGTDLTAVANDGTVFEATITVADQIQQASVSDLSAKKFIIHLLSQS